MLYQAAGQSLCRDRCRRHAPERALGVRAEPSPCETCEFYARRRVHRLACERFHEFTVSGGRRWRSLPATLPDVASYGKIYSGSKSARHDVGAALVRQ